MSDRIEREASVDAKGDEAGHGGEGCKIGSDGNNVSHVVIPLDARGPLAPARAMDNPAMVEEALTWPLDAPQLVPIDVDALIAAIDRHVELPESFANHPASVAELRSDKSDKPGDWTPRDALIAMLRDIDSGKEAPTDLIIVWTGSVGDSPDIGWRQAHTGSIKALGMLTRAIHRLNRCDDCA